MPSSLSDTAILPSGLMSGPQTSGVFLMVGHDKVPLEELPKEQLVELVGSLMARLQCTRSTDKNTDLDERPKAAILTIPHDLDLTARPTLPTLLEDDSSCPSSLLASDLPPNENMVTIPSIDVANRYDVLRTLDMPSPSSQDQGAKRPRSPVSPHNKRQKNLLSPSQSSTEVQSRPPASNITSPPLQGTVEKPSEEDVDTEMDDHGGEWQDVHSRRRKKGIPVVLRPSHDGDLRTIPPALLYSELVNTAGEGVSLHRFSSSGALTINVPTAAGVTKLSRTAMLGSVPVESKVAVAYTENAALVKGVPEWYSEKDLLEVLAPQGVSYVRRRTLLPTTSNPEGGSAPEIIIHFPHHMPLPRTVSFGLFDRRVRKFNRAPPRCYSCQRYGHIAAHCVAKEVKCSICSGAHDWKSCEPGTSPKCANCSEAHPATTPSCPKRLEAVKRAREFVLGSPSRNTKKSALTRRDHKRTPSHQRTPRQQDFPPLLPPRKVTGSLTFANVVGEVNGVSPRHVDALCNPSLSALKARQQTEREDLQRRQTSQLHQLLHDQQQSARQSAESQPSVVKVPPRHGAKEMLDFIMKTLEHVEPGREADTIAAIVAWHKALSPSSSTSPSCSAPLAHDGKQAQ